MVRIESLSNGLPIKTISPLFSTLVYMDISCHSATFQLKYNLRYTRNNIWRSFRPKHMTNKCNFWHIPLRSKKKWEKNKIKTFIFILMSPDTFDVFYIYAREYRRMYVLLVAHRHFQPNLITLNPINFCQRTFDYSQFYMVLSRYYSDIHMCVV